MKATRKSTMSASKRKSKLQALKGSNLLKLQMTEDINLSKLALWHKYHYVGGTIHDMRAVLK
jgi:hypothetical protein